VVAWVGVAGKGRAGMAAVEQAFPSRFQVASRAWWEQTQVLGRLLTVTAVRKGGVAAATVQLHKGRERSS